MDLNRSVVEQQFGVLLRDDKLDSFNVLAAIPIFWLVQSQPHAGSASTETLEVHTRCFPCICREILFKVLESLGGYIKHLAHT